MFQEIIVYIFKVDVQLVTFILCLLAFSVFFLKISKTFMFKLQKRGQRKCFFLSISESDGVFPIKFT